MYRRALKGAQISMRTVLWGFILALASPHGSTAEPRTEEIYVAIGDSYTIGEGVTEAERWPNVLAERLRAAGVPIRLAANPAKTGASTEEITLSELPTIEHLHPTFVTVLVGVNDQVRGFTPEIFVSNLNALLNRIQALLTRSGSDPHRLLLVTIPDYSATPAGKNFGDPTKARWELAHFNEIIRSEAKARGLAVADITPISREAAHDPALTAADGLHPSAEQYRRWVTVIEPLARKMLRKDP